MLLQQDRPGTGDLGIEFAPGMGQYVEPAMWGVFLIIVVLISYSTVKDWIQRWRR